MPTFAVLTQVLLLFLGVFLMIIILLQRGRGGGLAGAFGGLGGQSAFGTKAGDVFTKITVVIAVAWVLVAGGSGYFLRAAAESRTGGLPEAPAVGPGEIDPGATEEGGTEPFKFDFDNSTEPASDSPDVGEAPGTEDGTDAPADTSGDETTSTPDDGASSESPATDDRSSEDSNE